MLYMGAIRQYTKQVLSVAEQIDLLKSRGLNLTDYSAATKFLSEVSYFRFIQYLRPMEMDKTTHIFKANSQFEDAVALYNFDSDLRDLIFRAIQRIEIALRTKIIQEFSLEHGPFWFFPFFPPAWKTLELVSLGTLSKLYYNFQDNKLKKRIARQFNLPQQEVLESWMRSLSVLRNYCAHHSRIWNRSLPNAPQLKVPLRGPWINIEKVDANKLYAIVCCIAYWLDSMEYGIKFKTEIKTLLNSYPQVDPKAMGFPSNWETEPLWNHTDKNACVY